MKLENASIFLVQMPAGVAIEMRDHTADVAFAKAYLSHAQFAKFISGASTDIFIDVFALDRLGYEPRPEPVPDDAFQIVADLLEHTRVEFIKAADAWIQRKDEVLVSNDVRTKAEQIPVMLGASHGLRNAAEFVGIQISNLRNAGRQPQPCRESVIDELIEHLSEKADYCRFAFNHTDDETEKRYQQGREEVYIELCDFLRRAAKASVISRSAPWGHYLQLTRDLNIDFWNEIYSNPVKASTEPKQQSLFEDETA